MLTTENNSILRQISQQSIHEPINASNSCLLRGCFDHASQEWKDSTLDEKVYALKMLINDDCKNTLKLSMGMLDYCNKEAGKEIKLIDIVISMSHLIDHLLKEDS